MLDWPAAESLAFATLAVSGVRIRLSGQDSERGTFSQRHAVLHDEEDGRRYSPLQHLAEGQAPVEIYNSPLSELGVLGYEYGYSLDCPDGLVLWEAQFGYFVNAAQVIVDQFIASAETKWRRLSGLVLLLPHALEGMGPEHSSARLERFLALAADDNMQVVYPTTPAQYFHVLRRQRKPLIVMTPKSLLRLPAAASSLDELATGKFQRVLADDTADPTKVTRVVMCTGKIYYELVEERTRRKADHVAIVRLEKLYPWWPQLVTAAIASYSHLREVKWVQDEPSNMGAASFVMPRLEVLLLDGVKLYLVARAESASPATGSQKAHVIEEQQILAAAFTDS